MKLVFSAEVKKHKEKGLPILALESTILAHGMPYPENYTFAKKAESICRMKKVAPAIIAILEGKVHVGLEEKNLKKVCQSTNILKASQRDISFIVAKKKDGATTVSATSWITYKSGVSVFATGGIGGVHKNSTNTFDVSQDITTLATNPIVVVSAGAKAILDLPKTIESLETHGVPVFGYKTFNLPSFYSRTSDIKIDRKVNNAKDIAEIYHEHKNLGIKSSLLIMNPVPKENEIPKKTINIVIQKAIDKSKALNIKGKELTPFLLKTIVKETGGKSLKTNVALAINNIELGTKIAHQISIRDKLTTIK